MTKKVCLPNGNEVRLEIIRHPGAGLVIPFLSDDKVVMIEQLRPVIGAYMYELPAGTLKRNESPLACCRREIVEETGYSAAKFKFLGAIYPVPGYSTEKIHIYAAYGLSLRSREPEADEVIRNKIVTRPQVRRLFKAGKICDAKTICAFAYCGWFF